MPRREKRPAKGITIRAYGGDVPPDQAVEARAVNGALNWLVGQVDCQRSVGDLYRAYSVAAERSEQRFTVPPSEQVFMEGFGALFGVLEAAGMVSLRRAAA